MEVTTTEALKMARDALAYYAAAGTAGEPCGGDIAADAITALDATPSAAVAWHVHIIGCDGSADWVELGAAAPADIPPTAEALPLVYLTRNA